MNYMDKYNEWRNNPYFDKETKEELLNLEGNEKEIEDRFYKDLEFGTAGLRGVIAAGTNRINIYTVRRATFGLANYIIKNTTEEEKNRGVVIAHDNRHMSREFCIEAANTLAACGIKAYIFDSLRTTPELSFAVRNLNTIAGIVITASHNPPEYNGYKVYWEDGAQVMPHIANAITEEINSIHDYSTIPTLTEENKNLVVTLDEKADTEFIEAVKKQVIRKELIEKVGKEFKIVFTPLCGTGNKPIRRALSEVGFENILVVKEEENPDPNFAGIEYPNPEEQKALTRGIELAKENGADYLGIGAMFSTSTKSDAKLVSFNTLEEIIKEVNLPFVLIGGITLDNVKKLKHFKPDGYALVSGILGTDDISKRVEKWYERI